MDRRKIGFWILFLGLLLTTLLMSCGGPEEPTQVPAPPPTMRAAELLHDRCTACHTLDRVEAATKTEAEWDATVERMRGKGAELTDDEAQTLVEHLVEEYGP